jgi:hypothetical protein
MREGTSDEKTEEKAKKKQLALARLRGCKHKLPRRLNARCGTVVALDESPGKRLPNTAPTDRSTSKDAQFLRPGRLLNLAASLHAATWTI